MTSNVLYGIVGPTASGKTALAVAVAKLVNGEIISADSMQVYKGMDILSAKPTKEEIESVPHHMIGLIDPSESFSASKYRELVLPLIEDIRARGRLPILCGGTGLYINAVTKAISFSEKSDETLRSKLKAVSEEENGQAKLHDMLRSLDPESADKYPPGDVRRVIRSIEINLLTGMTRAEQEKADAALQDPFTARLYAIDWDRSVLYDRINRRVDQMVSMGLINEVASLLKLQNGRENTAVQAIGYKEIAEALKGNIAMSDAIVHLKTVTRNYAKRQLTWFRRDERVTFLNPDGETVQSLAEKIAATILNPEENK